MRHVGRLLAGLLLVVVLVAGMHSGVLVLRWPGAGDGVGVLDRRPEHPVALTSLGRHTKEAAGRASFRRYFTTMVLGETEEGGPDPVVAKWERPQVTVKLLNDGGPGVESYLRRLVARLNRMQQEVRFVVGSRQPRITVRFLPHDDYVLRHGDSSVGTTHTRYYRSSPGLISARIVIDAGRQDGPGGLKATLIHELTHAIGCAGHFTDPADRRASVLYQASHVTSWSQNDAAVVRLLYSPWIRSGMTAGQARAALRRYARTED